MRSNHYFPVICKYILHFNNWNYLLKFGSHNQSFKLSVVEEQFKDQLSDVQLLMEKLFL